MLNIYNFRENVLSIRKNILKNIKKSELWILASKLIIVIGGLSGVIYFIWAFIADFILKKPLLFSGWEIWVSVGPVVIFLNIKKDYKEKLGYLHAKLESIDQWEQHIENANKIIENNQDFIFYLRDFKGGANHTSDIPNYVSGNGGIPSSLSWKSRFGKESTFKFLNHFAKEFPIISLYNHQEKADIGSKSIILYPTDEYWYELFIRLLEKARFVIMDYSEIETANIEREIKAATELNQKKIILPDWSEAYKTSFFEKYPEVDKIVYSYY